MSINRFSYARIKTSEELAESLAIPLLYLLQGKAQVLFPRSFTAAPAREVRVRLLTSQVPGGVRAGFPVIVNPKQWRDVIVPILKQGLWDIPENKENKENKESEGEGSEKERGYGNLSPFNPIWTCSSSRLVENLKVLIKERADEMGYGNPTEVSGT